MSGDQLELDQIGFLRFRDRCAMANRCYYRTTVGDFGLKGLVELQLVPGHPTSDGAYPVAYDRQRITTTVPPKRDLVVR